jgi:hypothetical protein
VRHREFFCLAFVGGLSGLDKLVKEVLGLLGEKSVKRCVLPRIVARLSSDMKSALQLLLQIACRLERHLGSTGLEVTWVSTVFAHNFLDLASVYIHFLVCFE